MIVFPSIARLLLKLQPTKNRKPKPSIGFSQASTVGMFVHCSDTLDKEGLAMFHRKLKEQGKSVTVLYYCEKKSMPPTSPEGILLTDRDVAWYGAIRKKAALKFIRTTFDYLYVIAPKPEMITRYLLSRSTAATVIGQSHELLDDFQDLTIKMQPKEIDGGELLKQMYHYSTQLK